MRETGRLSHLNSLGNMSDYISPYSEENLLFDNLNRWEINEGIYWLTSKDLSYLFVSGFGVSLSKKSERLVIRHQNRIIEEIPFFRLKNIVILSKGVGISSDLVEYCCKYSIAVSFHDFSAKPIALLHSFYRPVHGRLKYAQINACNSITGVEIAARIVNGKISNQTAFLKYAIKNIRNDTDLENKAVFVAEKCGLMRDFAKKCLILDKSKPVHENKRTIMGYEGTAARLYWQSFAKLIEDKAFFEIREHGKIPRDAVNSLLNYGYGILYSRIWAAVVLAGLDPYVGFLHSDETGNPALVFDLIEEFRSAVVDKTVLAFIRLESRIKLKDGLLSWETRHSFNKKILDRLTSRENYHGQSIMIGDIILAQARHLVSVLEKKEAKYKPFHLKW